MEITRLLGEKMKEMRTDGRTHTQTLAGANNRGSCVADGNARELIRWNCIGTWADPLMVIRDQLLSSGEIVLVMKRQNINFQIILRRK
jgi:hypothetical protein